MSTARAGRRFGVEPAARRLGLGTMRTRVIAAISALALGGCIGVPLHISSVEEDLAKKADLIIVGDTDRAQVRQRLGELLLASDYWRFDAFRITEYNAGVLVFAGGIPVPAWNREDGYTLVAYDEHGRVADIQYGLRSGGMALDAPDDRASIAVTARDLQLRATGKETFLAVPPSRRDEYLHDVPAGERCRVLIGALDSIRKVTLLVDGQPGPQLPETMSDTLLLLQLAPGRHRLEVAGDGAATSGMSELQCAAGDLLYVALQTLSDAGGSRRPSVQLALSSERPFGFEYQALLIWGNGNWLVPQEL
jgi:hypothetical protein